MAKLIHVPVTSKEIGEFSKRDPIISNIINFVLPMWPTKVIEQLKQYFCRRKELNTVNCRLIWGNKVVVLFRLKEKVLIELHENSPDIIRMKTLVRSFVSSQT